MNSPPAEQGHAAVLAARGNTGFRRLALSFFRESKEEVIYPFSFRPVCLGHLARCHPASGLLILRTVCGMDMGDGSVICELGCGVELNLDDAVENTSNRAGNPILWMNAMV